MSSYLHDPQARYRKRSFERTKNFVLVVSLLIFTGVTSFWMGGLYAEETILALRKEIENYQGQLGEFEIALTEASADAQTAIIKYKDLEYAVSEVVTDGPMQELLVVLKEQLDKGASPKRLLAAVKSAQPLDDCSVPEVRRFVVSTPDYKGAQSVVEMAEGALKISASGVSSLSDTGAVQAWYDPSKAISVKFDIEGVGAEVKSGIMPIYKSVVIDDKEYRMSIEPGTKSFAQVRYDVCDLP